ncbi:MAG: thioredoxin domain-containing protein [Planctomycetota bacterium]|nr:thioredoxin domain-containing protein [Planctomycetota bacterium]
MDLEKDLFIVTASMDRPTEEQMIEAIKTQGFGAIAVPPEDGKDSGSREPSSPRKVFTMPRLVQDALDRAGKEGKLVLVDFSADWCAPCQRMLKETYKDERVVSELEGFIFLKIDTDAHPSVAKHFKVSGIPDARILAPDGTERARVRGFKKADELLPILEAARAGTDDASSGGRK